VMAAKARLLAAAALLASTTGCLRGCPSSKPPIHPNPSMDDQPKVLAQTSSNFFYDGSAMRKPVPGTIARGELRDDPAYFEGKDAAGAFIAKSPVTTTPEVVERGHQRFSIYCQPCHDARGEGHGILFQRGKVPTAALIDPKYVAYPDGQIYDVITNGFGLMSSYRWPIPPQDRWAIVAYVRDLQARHAATAAAGTPAVPAAAPAAAPATAPKAGHR
jgi:cbb3-type cytochrome c oxidase subunit III